MVQTSHESTKSCATAPTKVYRRESHLGTVAVRRSVRSIQPDRMLTKWLWGPLSSGKIHLQILHHMDSIWTGPCHLWRRLPCKEHPSGGLLCGGAARPSTFERQHVTEGGWQVQTAGAGRRSRIADGRVGLGQVSEALGQRKLRNILEIQHLAKDGWQVQAASSGCRNFVAGGGVGLGRTSNV